MNTIPIEQARVPPERYELKSAAQRKRTPWATRTKMKAPPPTVIDTGRLAVDAASSADKPTEAGVKTPQTSNRTPKTPPNRPRTASYPMSSSVPSKRSAGRSSPKRTSSGASTAPATPLSRDPARPAQKDGLPVPKPAIRRSTTTATSSSSVSEAKIHPRHGAKPRPSSHEGPKPNPRTIRQSENHRTPTDKSPPRHPRTAPEPRTRRTSLGSPIQFQRPPHPSPAPPRASTNPQEPVTEQAPPGSVTSTSKARAVAGERLKRGRGEVIREGFEARVRRIGEERDARIEGLRGEIERLRREAVEEVRGVARAALGEVRAGNGREVEADVDLERFERLLVELGGELS